jgi:hypothetical protein
VRAPDRLLEGAARDPRLDDDDPHAEGRDLDAQGVTDGLDGVLGRVVVPAEREGHPAAHRADVDDAPAAPLAHGREDELAHPGEAEDVGLEHRTDLVEVDLLHRAVLAVSRVVDEGADGTVDALDLGDGRAHGLLVGHVEGGDVRAEGLEVGEGVGPAGRRPDRVAGVQERGGGGTADPRGAAGDENGVVVARCHGVPRA